MVRVAKARVMARSLRMMILTMGMETAMMAGKMAMVMKAAMVVGKKEERL